MVDKRTPLSQEERRQRQKRLERARWEARRQPARRTPVAKPDSPADATAPPSRPPT